MKKIDFIFVGLSKKSPYRELEEFYHERIQHYTGSRILCLKDSSEKNQIIKIKKESEQISTKILPGDVVVICDERGRSLTSVALSERVVKWQLEGKRIVFVVGGAYGMTEEIVHQAHFVLKLSDFTLPHELARVVLLEQIYRSLSIVAGEKYHH